MAKKQLPGLYFKEGQGVIDKRLKGIGRVYRRFEASSQQEAELKYFEIIDEERLKHKTPEVRSFRQAATKYIKEATIRSIDRDAQALAVLNPYIGKMTLDKIHMGSLQRFIDGRRKKGIRSGTIRRDLATVRHILNLASRIWRDENDKPWLLTAPLLKMPDWEEQRRLFQELPGYLAKMALWAVNTGAREQVVCGLRWDWECPVPELDTSVFITPGKSKDYALGRWRGEKNKEDGLYVLSSIARSIVEAQRGLDPVFVFPYKGQQLHKMQTSGWKRAWIRAGLPDGKDIRKGPHNLKHTVGRRLRNAGVPFETRKVLLHHTDGDVTTNYSPAEISELINAVERLTTTAARGTLIRRRRIR